MNTPVECPTCFGCGMLTNSARDPQDHEDGECHMCCGDGTVFMCDADEMERDGTPRDCGQVASELMAYVDEEREWSVVYRCDEHANELRSIADQSDDEIVTYTIEYLMRGA